jgi:hypothetical protein
MIIVPLCRNKQGKSSRCENDNMLHDYTRSELDTCVRWKTLAQLNAAFDYKESGFIFKESQVRSGMLPKN